MSKTCDEAAEIGLAQLVMLATTDVTVTDVEKLDQVHTGLDCRNLLVAEYVVDAGYSSAELMVVAQREFGITLLGLLHAITPSRPAPGAVSTAPRSPLTGTTSGSPAHKG